MYAGNLRVHKIIHTGEKPFECKQCGERFSQAGNLRVHESNHTGKKPFECKQCGKCFIKAGILRVHKRFQPGEKPFECKQCGKCFSQAGNLKQHAKKVVSDSPGLVDFSIGLVIFVLNLPDGLVLFFGKNSTYRRIVINPADQKGFGS